MKHAYEPGGRKVARFHDCHHAARIELAHRSQLQEHSERATVRILPSFTTVRLVNMACTVAALWLGACATPGEPSLLSSDRTTPVSSAVQNWPCPNLTNALNVHVTKIITLQAQGKAELEAAPRTLMSALSRLAGTDNPMASQIEPERNAADAYNAALRGKGCPTVDIDARLAAAKVAPVPVVAAAIPPEQAAKKPRK